MQWWSYAWLSFLLLFFVLSVIIKFLINKYRNSPIWNAFSILCLNIFIFILLGGVSLPVFDWEFWTRWMPSITFIILAVLYLLSQIIFLLVFYGKMEEKTAENWSNKVGFNFLKGFGGDTFAEFSWMVGLLVTVGLYLPYGQIFWVAAQIAALISVVSAAAYVPRYAFDKQKRRKNYGTSPGKNYQNLSHSIAALLTVIVICFPSQNNVDSLEVAPNGWVFFLCWSLVMLMWVTSAFLPARKISKARSEKTYFLTVTMVSIVISIIVSVIFVIFSYTYTDTEQSWPFWIIRLVGIIIAILIVLGTIFKLTFDPKEEGQKSIEDVFKMLLNFKDICFIFTGFLVFIGQIFDWIWDPFLTIPPWKELYGFVLGFMAYNFLIGILLGAYKLSKKSDRGTQRSDQAKQIELTQISST